MTHFDDSSTEDYIDENISLLPAEEALDDQEVGEDLDEGYSAAERPLAISAWGTTAAEESGQESLDRLLSREEPDIGAQEAGDGLGDTVGSDGELIDDQVGDRRAGRLVSADLDGADSRSDFWAVDAGIDGAGASAEEAAVHVVSDEESDY